ncbi:coiled-coil domain-containing protein 136 isoform X2 [Anolis sagrei]|uniref:coiled-coil domain-containing protein 136 isoform X2 n=1 Tax=Anolis sagrei TaxID=38937 RepID=UPI0035205B28
MEAAGMQLPSSRRKDGAGEVDTSNTELNEEEEEDEEDEEEEEEEEEAEGEGVPVKNLGSLDDDDEDKASDLSDQELDQNLRAQVLQLLDELEEARETALKHEDDSLELQGLLEDERLASAQQAEIFTKQIQRLQAQMRSLKDEFDSLQEVKDVELERVERELREANEEIHNLRLDAEEAAALHENEIAGLQEELCRLKAELDRVQLVRNEYDMEITALRAEINMKKSPPGTADSQSVSEVAPTSDTEERLTTASEDVAQLQEDLQALRAQYQDLSDEYQILQESNRIMVHQLERLEAIKYKTRSKSDDSQDSDSEPEPELVQPNTRRVSIARRNTLRAGASVSFKSAEIVGTSSTEGDDKMDKLEEESEYDLQCQLEEEEEKVELVQAQQSEPETFILSLSSHRGWRTRSKELTEGELAARRKGSEYEPEMFSLSPSSHRGWRTRSKELTEGELAARMKGSELDELRPILCQKESQRSYTERKPRVKDLKEGESIDLRKGMERGTSKCDQAHHTLREMESKCRRSKTEWEQLHEELRLCKEEIERLNGTIPIGGRVPAGGMKPFALFVVLAGALFLYPCLKRCSPS